MIHQRIGNASVRGGLWLTSAATVVLCVSNAAAVAGPRAEFVSSVKSSPSGFQTDIRLQRLTDRVAEARQRLQQQMQVLAAQCRDQGYADALGTIADFSGALADRERRPPPAVLVRAPLSSDAPFWKTRLREIGRGGALEIYRLARTLLRAGYPTEAYHLMSDVLLLDPDHKSARAIIGQQLFIDPLQRDEPDYAGEWLGAFAAEMRGGRRPHVQHPEFGWIPVDEVARFEVGERPWRSGWISAAREKELRRDFASAWEIPSEHFVVKTNVSREVGLEISQRLEQFHDWLYERFTPVFETKEDMRQRFEEAFRRTRREPMVVHYYATKDEYRDALRGVIPPGIDTNGFYYPPHKTSYFFPQAGNDFSTLYHEATHQILDLWTRADQSRAAQALAARTRQPRRPWVLGERTNFWLIEGLACYLESVQVIGGHIKVGAPDYIRFRNAHDRVVRDGFFIPLGAFCRLGKQEVQTHPEIGGLYSQASGLTYFLMHAENGRYRPALVQLLAAVYRPDPRTAGREPSLADIAGTSFDDLDRRYQQFWKEMTPAVGGMGP